VTVFHFEKLTAYHDLTDFDCGSDHLNRFLKKFALQNQLSNASQTYLCIGDGKAIGYFTLVVGELVFEDVPERLRKGLARHPIPVMVLARLAIDQNWQGQGLGVSALKDALMRCINASDIAGIRAVIVHAKDETARSFYAHFGFVDGLPDPLHQYILIKDLKKLLVP
jgi:GNAT superfamily N-acetyltransferase